MPRSSDHQAPCGPHAPIAPQGTLTASQLPANAGPSGMVHSGDLLRGQRTLDIQHNGTVYRLQTTKLGKLILTK
jgi:hemin uptake protein HemP